MISISGGQIPSFEIFQSCFEKELKDKKFNICLGDGDIKRLGSDISGNYDPDELYQLVRELVEVWDGSFESEKSESAYSLASCILSCIDIEWI